VYRVEIDGPRARVEMTMTSPACPLGDYLKDLVRSAIRSSSPDVQDVAVTLVWEPRWNADMMSVDARRQLGAGR
jgi:metal-sulfur cluster biosynthetic enzyme